MKVKVLTLFVALSLAYAFAAFAADEAPKAGEAPKPEIKYGQAVGDNIQPVVVTTLDGASKVEIAKLQKKTIFVMVSSVCTACRKEIQEMSVPENYEKIKAKADVFGVIIDMEPKSAAERIGQTPFPLLADADYKIGNATNLLSTPSTLIVEAGKIVYSKAGYRPGQWKEYIQ